MNFTDEYLLRNDLKITTPEAESALLKSVPDNGEIPTIVGWYEERPPGGKKLPNYSETYVWCAHCQAKTHWAGYLARYSDGSGVLVGNGCGKKQYGVEFERVEREFTRHKNRQAYLRQFATLNGLVINIIQELHSAIDAPAVNWFHDLRRSIAFNHSRFFGSAGGPDTGNSDAEEGFDFPVFSSTMAKVVASNGGQLFTIVKERNFAAEEIERERIQKRLSEYDQLTTTAKKSYHDKYGRPKRGIPTIYKEKPKNIAALQGSDLFAFEVTPKATFERLWQRSKALYAEMFRFPTNSRSTAELRETVEAFREIADLALAMQKAIAEPKLFFAPRNLANIVECLNSVLAFEGKPGRYTTEGRIITYTSRSGEKNELSNKQYPSIDLSSLIQFRETLSSRQPLQREDA